MTRTEERRSVPTSIPYNEGAKKQPYYDGVFYKSVMPPKLAEQFKTLKNPELDKIRTGHVKATNLGPGITPKGLETFRLLKQDPVLVCS